MPFSSAVHIPVLRTSPPPMISRRTPDFPSCTFLFLVCCSPCDNAAYLMLDKMVGSELPLSLQCYLRLSDIDFSIGNAFEIHVLHQFIVLILPF